MYRLIVKLRLRKSFRRLSRRDYEPIVKLFGPSSRLLFSGDHALGGERRGADGARQWFGEVYRLFPDLRLEPQAVIVNGWPWNTVAATRFTVSAGGVDGSPYRNEGMQFLRLRWGRVVEDLLFEDTLKLEAELRRRAGQEVTAAVAPVAQVS